MKVRAERLMRLGLLTLMVVTNACTDDAVVGENSASAPPHTNGEVSVVRPACKGTPSTLPAEELNYGSSPLLWVEGARGSWSNDAGDVLEVRIAEAATRIESSCENPSGAAAPASATTPSDSALPILPEGPAATFELRSEVTLRTADGGWNETAQAFFRLRAAHPGSSIALELSGRAELSFAMFQGTYRLPTNLPKPPLDHVVLDLTYQRTRWILTRQVYADNSARDGGAPHVPSTADSVPVWSGETLVFTKP